MTLLQLCGEAAVLNFFLTLFFELDESIHRLRLSETI